MDEESISSDDYIVVQKSLYQFAGKRKRPFSGQRAALPRHVTETVDLDSDPEPYPAKRQSTTLSAAHTRLQGPLNIDHDDDDPVPVPTMTPLPNAVQLVMTTTPTNAPASDRNTPDLPRTTSNENISAITLISTREANKTSGNNKNNTSVNAPSPRNQKCGGQLVERILQRWRKRSQEPRETPANLLSTNARAPK